LARSIQKSIGRPGYREFLKIVENNHLKDDMAAERIFGPDLGSLKGKTVRCTPNPVDITMIDIPPAIMATYRDVILAGDIMFVNKTSVFVTISRHIRLFTTEMLYN
jgi:hypothetical protein